MKLSDFVKDRKVTSFKFTSVEIKPSQTTPGEKIAVLHLAEPIEKVTGSQFVGEPDDRVRMEAENVDTVSIYQRDMDDEGITVNDDGSGEVNSDLQLDVANSGEVWLTSKTFRQFGIERRTERSNERKSGIRNRMEERKARAALERVSGNGSRKEEATPVVTENDDKGTSSGANGAKAGKPAVGKTP